MKKTPALRQVARVEIADVAREDGEERDARPDHEDPEADSERAPHQTRLTTVRPKRPVGLMRRTTRITASAKGVRRSVPIQPT